MTKSKKQKMRVRKKFEYNGTKLRIVERYESGRKAIRVLAPNGGLIPISIQRKETLRSIEEKAIAALDNFKKLGANVEHELNREI